MMTLRKSLLLAAAVSLAGCQQAASAPAVVAPVPAAVTSPVETKKIRPVASNQVCMVTNRFMGTDQIRVDIAEKTYFGCCEMCQGRLMKETHLRTATDPVTGRQVDKAIAVIGALPNGEVRYFENEASLGQFTAL